MLRLYYRISDKSYPKAKLPGSNKEVCFMNFCEIFANEIFSLELLHETPMRIIADNCKRKTVKTLMETGIPVTITNLGNSGSLRKSFEIALEESEDDDILYFCEDDYLHLHDSPQILKEGLSISDYVTLYDHPDKYTKAYRGGEVSKVMRTFMTHWRFTQSTCMTFGCKAKTLKEDKEIWDKWTEEDHPHDHKVFTELGKEKERKIAVPIPGLACHTDLTFSGSINNVMIDSWAIQMMINELESKINKDEMYEKMIDGKQGWSKLIALDAIHFNNNLE